MSLKMYPSLDAFKADVGSHMLLPAIIGCIFNAEAGLAFPEEMGKTTKLELTSNSSRAATTSSQGSWSKPSSMERASVHATDAGQTPWQGMHWLQER